MTEAKRTVNDFATAPTAAQASMAADIRARLLRTPARSPATPIERLTVEYLRANGEVSLDALIERVALEIYREELRNGAWVLDIGLFGSRLFTRDVNREVRAGDGILWEIRDKRETV